jgi:hypothetical protein
MRIRNTGIMAEMVLTRRMLNKKLTMKDIESIDPEFFNSLVWIRQGLVLIKQFCLNSKVKITVPTSTHS